MTATVAATEARTEAGAAGGGAPLRVLLVDDHLAFRQPLALDPANPSTSITNAMEFLAPEAILQFCPERFEWDEVVVLLEHYPEERDKRGWLGRRATWDRVAFDSWAPRRVWFGGQERLSLGEPEWRPMPAEEVAALIGEDEAKG